MRICETCKHWDKSNSVELPASENRFLHIIGVNDNSISISICKEIIYHSVDGYYEIGFGNNFGCRRYLKDED